MFAAAGCTTNKHFYTADGQCITCWNNPLTGEPLNHSGTAEKKKTVSQTKGVTDQTKESSQHSRRTPKEGYQVEFSVPVNVNLAFVRLKKEFNYYTEQEIRSEYGSQSMANAKIQTFSYAYDAVPSTYYHMRSYRKHDGYLMTIDSMITLQNSQESLITVTYWPRDFSLDPVEVGKSLKQRIHKALKI